MATHDYVIANGTGSAVRADLNNALAAIVSNNSSSSEPSTRYAYQWWADTTTGQLKLRNAANNGWVTIFELDGTMLMEDGTVSAPGLAFASDLNTGFFSGGADKLNFATGGIERLEIGSSEVVFNDPSNDVDFRVESNGQTHMLFVDAGNNRVCIGNSAADGTLHVYSNSAGSVTASSSADDLVIENNGDTGISILTADGNNSTAVMFGCPSQTVGAAIRYNHNSSEMSLGPDQPGAHLRINSGDGIEAARIDSSGRVGMGVSSPNSRLHIKDSNSGGDIGLRVQNNTSGANSTASIHLTTSATDTFNSATIKTERTSGALIFERDGNERLRIDSAGDVAIGVSAATSRLTVEDSAATKANFTHSSSNKTSLYIESDDTSARIGSTYYGGGGSFKPLSFLTSGSERVRIDGSGNTWFNSSNFSTLYPGEGNTATGFFVESDGKATISRANTNPLTVNRNTSDGTLIDLRQAGSQEGTISVSGSTVSYNGAHLSRWSQLAAGAARTEILRGSVLSNLDEMCEWGEEDNEQLNRMQVSDVEGDKNVSGVFQGWDDDDDTYTNDFYCAMTGDFVIRIAQGTTVARGDLLMSAGDGTAKHQDDDIVRSKTIAKVTSTTVSETYADNSYCVPCVLMAC